MTARTPGVIAGPNPTSIDGVFTLPPPFTPSQRKALTSLLTAIDVRLRPTLAHGSAQGVVVRGGDCRPDARLEVDLSFLYKLLRGSRVRVSGQCSLILNLETEAREALDILDIGMRQFRAALGERITPAWRFYAYAQLNRSHIPPQDVHQDYGKKHGNSTYFTGIHLLSEDGEPTEFRDVSTGLFMTCLLYTSDAADE